MTAPITRYRVVSYVPNPSSDDRVTVGAVLEQPDGTAKVVPAPALPNGLGSEIERASFVLARKLLFKLKSVDDRPESFGPQIRISESRECRSADPDRFIERLLFGRSGSTTPIEAGSSTPRLRKRSAHGRAYFDARGIKRDVVRADYRPSDRSLMWPITHYVESAEELLLLEPLSPLREQRLIDDLRDVASRFHAYHDVLDTRSKCTMMVYVLPGFPARKVEEFQKELAEISTIVNLGRSSEEDEFLEKIRVMAGLTQELGR